MSSEDRRDNLPVADSGQIEVYTMTDLEQVKVLADPLRLRILENLCDGPRTTKQVAELLGEKPTRLYHHVDALERVGLIRLSETRQVRGTVEKYYKAVARLIHADPSVFSGTKGEQRDTMVEVVSTFFERTALELGSLVEWSQANQTSL